MSVDIARDPERLARVALNRLAEPGDMRLTSLTAELGAMPLYALLRAERDLAGLRTDVAARLVAVQPERELEDAARLGLRFVIPSDEEWPAQLNDLAACAPAAERGGVPVGLWVKGPLRLDQLGSSLAVVGARSATTYGASVAGEIAGTCAAAGVVVISGGAFGIDVAAHRGALSVDGTTVAVLACGADRVYPAANGPLLDHLAVTTAVVSEGPPGCAPHRVRFLARNRLIAALAGATVVVEAARRSGALNTANWASRLNRTVMGVPGPVTSAASVGVHEQLRTGGMQLVTGGPDVLELVGETGQHLVEPRRGEDRVRDRLTPRQQQVLDAVPTASGAGADSVARVAGIGLLEVRSLLARLRDEGLVELGDGGWCLSDAAR